MGMKVRPRATAISLAEQPGAHGLGAEQKSESSRSADQIAPQRV